MAPLTRAEDGLQAPAAATPALVTDPQGIRSFAAYFKNYMSVFAVVVAALPVPAAQLELIPVYQAHKGLFSVATSVFCFLLLGLIFSARHAIASALFTDYIIAKPKGGGLSLHSRWVMQRSAFFLGVMALIGLSLFSLLEYLDALRSSVADSAGPAREQMQNAIKAVVSNTSFYEIKNSKQLILSYCLFFLFAEAAFVLLAIREYLQDTLRLNDTEIIQLYRPSVSTNG